mmetsp:Transcript_1595/g.3124  ORF Transcript_1595/g.3124 Transcript_1595/m.3124 type:complete len:410 (+) Transcript_1595:34-1263(+)
MAYPAGAEGGVVCKNCALQIAKPLRCGICKAASYCSSTCQKEDWQFHKRVCRKAEPKQEAKPVQDETAQKEELDKLMADMGGEHSEQVKQMMAGMMGMGEGKKEEVKAPDPPCQNCSEPCRKTLRCGTCKSVTYCSAQCQKDDWRFHKRLCKKPEKPAAASEPVATSEPVAAPPSEQKQGSPKRPKEANESINVANEDVGTWYSHRNWKPEEPHKDFIPSKLEGTKEGAEPSAGSAWNAAGTWEEKNMMPWWEKKLQDFAGLSDGEVLTVEKVDGIKGDASIVHVRGQPKFLCDMSFDLHFSGLQRCKACLRSPPGSRCSNCMRILGQISVSEVACDTGALPSLNVKAGQPPGPDHVKKANKDDCKAAADAYLMPAVKDKLDSLIIEYKALVPDAPKWASQLPPREGNV